MRWIATRVRRVTCGVFLATLFTLVGCGGTSLRRPLVTDQTPLGTPREQVRAWHRANGWCGPAEPQRIEIYRPCDGPDRRRVATQLVFDSEDRLIFAAVFAKVPRGGASARGEHVYYSKAPQPAPSTRYEPGPASDRVAREPRASVIRYERSEERGDLAGELLDALAFEIVARHGEGQEPAPGLRMWKTTGESIFMYVLRGWVVEAHASLTCRVCAP
jgi:hypothetical protein